MCLEICLNTVVLASASTAQAQRGRGSSGTRLAGPLLGAHSRRLRRTRASPRKGDIWDVKVDQAACPNHGAVTADCSAIIGRAMDPIRVAPTVFIWSSGRGSTTIGEPPIEGSKGVCQRPKRLTQPERRVVAIIFAVGGLARAPSIKATTTPVLGCAAGVRRHRPSTALLETVAVDGESGDIALGDASKVRRAISDAILPKGGAQAVLAAPEVSPRRPLEGSPASDIRGPVHSCAATGRLLVGHLRRAQERPKRGCSVAADAAFGDDITGRGETPPFGSFRLFQVPAAGLCAKNGAQWERSEQN